MLDLKTSFDIFLSDLEDLLLNGKNAVVLVPLHYECDLKERIYDLLSCFEVSQVLSLDAYSDSIEPFLFIKKLFSEHCSSQDEFAEFSGPLNTHGITYLDVSTLDPDLQLCWLKYLIDYSSFCINRRHYERTTFCISANIYPNFQINNTFTKLLFFSEVDEYEFKYLINRKIVENQTFVRSPMIEYLENLVYELSYPNRNLALHLIDSWEYLLQDANATIQLFIKEQVQESLLEQFNDAAGYSPDRALLNNWREFYHGLLFAKKGRIYQSIVVDLYMSKLARLHQINWVAQIKVFFPILEITRSRLVKILARIIKTKGLSARFHQLISTLGRETIEDLEFSHIYSVIHTLNNEIGFENYQNLSKNCKKLKMYRNQLAHNCSLNYQQINNLLRISNDIHRLKVG